MKIIYYPDENFIRLGRIKTLFQYVGTLLIRSCSVFGIKRFYRTHFRQLHAFHKAIDPFCAYVYAIFTIQTIFHLVSSETFLGFCIQFNNTAADSAVFKFSFGGFVMKKFVISASVDVKHTAKRCYSVFR